jgi:hypothetical protein
MSDSSALPGFESLHDPLSTRISFDLESGVNSP